MIRFRAISTIALASAIVGSVTRADAAVPTTITEQGRVFDLGSTPVTATIQAVFSIYSVPTAGTALWTETQTLTIADGYFSTQLGSVTPFTAGLFDGTARYLGVKLGSDAEMSPRQLVTSVPYAQYATTADMATNATNAATATNATGDITPSSVTTPTATVTNLAGTNITSTGGMIIDREGDDLTVGCGGNNCWTNANGVIGFVGSNVQHGQIAFYPGTGFRFINSSPQGPANDYGPTPNHIAVYAASFNTVSSRNYKNDIRYLGEKEHGKMLSALSDVKIANYKLNGDIDPKERHIGFIAEELPKDVLSKDGKSVDVYELLTFTVGAMKAQQSRIETLESQIQRLEKDLARRR